jgi:hypothetical protein
MQGGRFTEAGWLCLINFKGMHLYQWIALGSLLICIYFSTVHFFRLLRLGKPKDYSSSAGNTGSAIRYSFTGAMSPHKKESAFLHLPTYVSGIIFHLGTFLSIALFFFILTGIRLPGPLIPIIFAFIIVSSACGVGMLIKRTIKKGLRDLSSPDDYISNLLVTFFQIMTGLVLLRHQILPVYLIMASILLVYFPVGKLRHAIYFFAARYHLGFFYGWRGVWPPKHL